MSRQFNITGALSRSRLKRNEKIRREDLPRKGDGDERGDGGGDERASVNAARLGAQPRDQVFVLEPFFARVHVARPARSQRDSSLLARLQESQASDPDGKEHDEAQSARRVRRH